MHRFTPGFTLIEIMIVISIVALMAAVAAPQLFQHHVSLTLRQEAQQVQSLLNHARRLAMLHQQRVFVCSAISKTVDLMNQKQHCSDQGDWIHGITVVLDSNDDGLPNTSDPIMLYQGPSPYATQLRWRGFRGKNRIEFLAHGMTHWQNGRFTLCRSGQNILGLEVVINASGRSYLRPAAFSGCAG